MIVHENRLLADDSPEISYQIFFRKFGKMSQNLSSAAVVIATLRFKLIISYQIVCFGCFTKHLSEMFLISTQSI